MDQSRHVAPLHRREQRLQFWLNDNGKGYRGDGAFGQLCIVIPDRGVTFILLAEATNMQREMDVIMDFIEHDDAPDGLQMAVKLALDVKIGRRVNYRSVIARPLDFRRGAY